MKRFICLITALLLAGPRLLADNPPATSDDLTRELMRFSGNIHQFNNIFPQEKVYLEFDNTAYFQGETIWFKAFVTHATTLKRAPSKVLYVDFLAPTGQLILQQKLKVVAGQCDGAIPLVDAATAQAREKRGIMEYPSGFYEIRAYTQNMLDFSHEAIFSRVIPVYTKPKHEGEFDNTHVVLKEDNPLIQGIRQEADEEDRKVNVSFYPEGGDLIAGLPCNVAFKATGPDGYELNGALVYQDEADTAYTIHDGMGLFTIVPKGSETVHFIGEDGKRTRFTLPKALKSGYSMTTLPCSDSLLQVSVARTSDLTEEQIALSVTCRGDVIYFQEILDDNSSQFDIDCSSWPIGVCRMTLYNKDGKILSSRSIFHNNDRFKSPTISFSTDSMSRQPFSKEIMNLKLTDKDGKPLRDRFCLSVRDASDYGSGQTENLQSNLLLSSDLKGYIHDPAWYLAANDQEHRTALNLLTLVQGWERYEWKYMTGQKFYAEKHRIEDSLTMNGWVLSYSKRVPVSDIDVYASVMPQYDKTKFETFEYHTDTTGYFGFDLTDFYGKAKMTINLMSKKKNGKSKFEKSTRIKFERSDRPEAKPFLKQEIDLTRNKANKKDSQPDFTDDGLPLVIREDLGIVLDDVDITEKRQFVDFDTFTSWDAEKDAEMELDLGEYTTDVAGYFLEQGIRFDDEVIQPYFYVHNQQKVLDKKPFDNPMGIDMIDVKSIIVYDKPMFPSYFVEFTPLLVDMHTKRLDTDWFIWVDTCWDRFYLIDIQIKNDRELLSYKDISNLGRRTTTIDGFSVPVEFYSPQYPEGAVYGDVDARRTLYWNANVITDDEGNARVEFYNNSYSTRYTISGAGITASGIPYILNQNW
ncbi:MAG: hypothetical protein J5596_04400 [Bacteroidaceae bacterium]|nr:hypothetical protein [Bacteroidaceae bacterium]